MARWIHEFRSTGERALTDAERLTLRRRVVRLGVRRWSLGFLSVVAFVGVFLCIAVAAGENPLGWVGALASLVAACYLLSWASNAEKLALLHRRALRLGTVEGFRRVRGDETVRRIWDGRSREDGTDDDDGHGFHFLGTYWSVDEKFEESLARAARKNVESFEAVARDGAVLWVEGRPVKKIIEPPVWEVL